MRMDAATRVLCLKQSLKIFLVAVAALLWSTFVPHASAQAGKGASIVQLQKDIPELMKRGEIPGLSIAVIRHGKTQWVHAFGVKNAKTNEPVTDDTVFQAASLSKPVFAYGVLKLVDQGRIDLDVPLTTYLPYPDVEGDDRLGKITARLVLSHRSGFSNWRSGDKLKIFFTPGERFSYSGEGMIYLQKVVEKITGKRLNDYMTQTVFEPLGMASSSYLWRKDYETRMATGHEGDGDPADAWKPDKESAAASLLTTAKDYALFVEAVLNGRGLKPSTLHEMEKQQVAVDPDCIVCTDHPPKELSKNVFWGLGWGIEASPKGESIWHWGDNGEFKAFVLASLRDKSSVVIFTNSSNGQSITKALVEEIMGRPQPVFAWTKFDAYDSPSMLFAEEVRDKGATAALRDFSDALKGGAISESTVNSVGSSLLRKKQNDDAVLVFQKNVELHPDSSNAYDSLGEAYMDVGQKELAIKNYERSLEVNPQNDNGKTMLEKLRGQ
jgi:CubicO group peptidase (beta-lactamase class C family)